MSPFQTEADYYPEPSLDREVQVYAQIQNTSADTIELEPFSRMRFFRGGQGLLDIGGLMDVPPEYTQSVILEPSQTVSVNLSVYYPAGECYIAELYYRVLGGEAKAGKAYVMYSNLFQIGELDDDECPTGAVQMTVLGERRTSQLDILTRSTGRWIIPFCYEHSSAEEVIGWGGPLRYPYTTLERLTDWGTWEVLQPTREDCSHTYVEPLMLVSETRTVDVWGATQFDWQQLSSGWYRWHIRYYDLLEFQDGRPLVVAYRNWFTEVFFIGE
jgi:hypothetical protein